ncbi:uncharacterized protein F5Z01DRAFT_457401 [Emericellopsis atlantica]|uniref:Erythromycin biosynthesis protein CIII-like C-terminal domain-containing protein n=1 Tax=Emericellopsis atlantica TaxID=2614577 RepID=A0A9P8CTX6_9HYPO|nr:uncharacterized protein F5Z01DRAFT_457401 [Emericellopsis atlantica]KAG9257206.1 hypothetical protein F5Z01DRAFT_457401 [Emericellopsis atlantica]
MVITADSRGAEGPHSGSNAWGRPRLLMCASPASGHSTPVINLAYHLAERGYNITFIAGEQFEATINKLPGKVRFVKCPPYSAFGDPEAMADREATPTGTDRFIWDMKHLFVATIPERYEVFRKTLEELKEQDPEADDPLVVTESFFMGSLPMYLGGPLPKGYTKRPRVVNIHAVLYMARTEYSAPCGMALPRDASDEGRVKNVQLHDEAEKTLWDPVIQYQQEILNNLGAQGYEPTIPLHTWMVEHDVTLQMCCPSLDYPRGDQHPKIRNVGALPPRPLKADFACPPFWDEVTRGDRKVITVTQGTVALEYGHLIMPTIRALADRDDILVVAILGSKGAQLPEGVAVPGNARVIDVLNYDAVLPHSSVFVFNAGFGGLTHGGINGVPMVFAGDTEDKPEVGLRGEWAGVGINLKTGQPSPEQIGEAVDRILADDSYKRRVMDVKAENEAMDAMDEVEKVILEQAALA